MRDPPGLFLLQTFHVSWYIQLSQRKKVNSKTNAKVDIAVSLRLFPPNIKTWTET